MILTKLEFWVQTETKMKTIRTGYGFKTIGTQTAKINKTWRKKQFTLICFTPAHFSSLSNFSSTSILLHFLSSHVYSGDLHLSDSHWTFLSPANNTNTFFVSLSVVSHCERLAFRVCNLCVILTPFFESVCDLNYLFETYFWFESCIYLGFICWPGLYFIIYGLFLVCVIFNSLFQSYLWFELLYVMFLTLVFRGL